ncbi:MAG: rane protein in aromatic hydrocarbon degradation [Myxococcaceae bacterium]|nr:rane protein in aromatic hydrocarbon degradation [Myxococcaceae bacterium]
MMNKSVSGLARVLLVLATLMSALLPYSRAHAGGLYLFDRGARALGRGGAFVAGADDPSALWYNPAGLIASKRQLVADAVLPILVADFTRHNADGVDSPKISPKPTPIPIPTLAFSHDLGHRDLVFGAGIIAPNVVLMNYDSSVGPQHAPSPARYSLLELKGTALANLTAGVAWEASHWLSIGGDVMVQTGYFRAKTALSACDGVICSFSEQKDFDAYATIKTIPTYGFTGVVGAIANFDILRFGFSMMLPYTLRGVGSASVKLPTNSVFDDASVHGDKAKLSIKFPTILRWGSEIRLISWLRMEGAVVWEQWSRQKTIDVKLDGVSINNVTGLGNYGVGTIHLPRDMKNVWSIRGGFEATIPHRWIGKTDFQIRGGLAYEKGAFTKKTITPLTLDTNKVVLSGGLTLGLLKWLRFDTTAGIIFMQDIDTHESEIRQPAAIRPPLKTFASVIGNGNYQQNAFFLGGGFRAMLDMKSGFAK